MVWIVRTTYCAGIFLSKKRTEKYIGAEIEEYADYDEALEQIKIVAERPYIQPDEIRPNRLYQIKDRRVYWVVFNNGSVGFMNNAQKDKFMASLTEEMSGYIIQGPFEYGEAVQRVKCLGAKTGKSKMLARKIPVSGHLYWR